jgi:hypothetical protein
VLESFGFKGFCSKPSKTGEPDMNNLTRRITNEMLCQGAVMVGI